MYRGRNRGGSFQHNRGGRQHKSKLPADTENPLDHRYSNIDRKLAVETFLLEIPTRHKHFEWKIMHFFHLPNEKEYCVTSPRFILMSTEWIIKLFPNDSQISAILEEKVPSIYRPKHRHQFAFKLGIKRDDGSIFESIDPGCQIRFGYSWRAVIEAQKLANLKNILAPSGNLTLVLAIQLVDGKDSALWSMWNDGAKTLGENLKDMMQSGDKTDVTILVKGQEFQAHSFILEARSRVFASMFRHDMSEKSDRMIKIDDCDPEFFLDFLYFLYTGSFDRVVYNNSRSLYEYADKYDLKELGEECTRCMARGLAVDSFCEVVLLAAVHRESELLDIAINFFIQNAKTILTTESWEQLLDKHSVFANELLIELVNHKDSAGGRTNEDALEYIDKRSTRWHQLLQCTDEVGASSNGHTNGQTQPFLLRLNQWWNISIDSFSPWMMKM